MSNKLVAIVLITLVGASYLSIPVISQQNDLEAKLSFEIDEQSSTLAGWRAYPPLNYSLDSLEVYNGAHAARLQNSDGGNGGIFLYHAETCPLMLKVKNSN